MPLALVLQAIGLLIAFLSALAIPAAISLGRMNNRLALLEADNNRLRDEMTRQLAKLTADLATEIAAGNARQVALVALTAQLQTLSQQQVSIMQKLDQVMSAVYRHDDRH